LGCPWTEDDGEIDRPGCDRGEKHTRASHHLLRMKGRPAAFGDRQRFGWIFAVLHGRMVAPLDIAGP
jgi:hypothetical protein